MLALILLVTILCGDTLAAVPGRHKRSDNPTAAETVKLWPGQVIYRFDGDFKENETQLIKDAMAEWRKYICVAFKPIEIVRFYIGPTLTIKLHDKECSADLGFGEGSIIRVQMLNVTRQCLQKGTVLRLLATVLGIEASSANGQSLSVADVRKVHGLYACSSAPSSCSPCPGEDEIVSGTCQCLTCSGPSMDSCQEAAHCRDKKTKSQCEIFKNVGMCEDSNTKSNCRVTCEDCTPQE